MVCSKCGRVALNGVSYAGKKYCAKHFLELMEKRVRKHLRINEPLDVGRKYTIFDDGSSELLLTEYFLKRIFSSRLKIERTKNINEADILPTNLDEIAIRFLEEFFKNEDGRNDSFVRPLKVLLQSEIKLICDLVGIKFIPRIKDEFLDGLESNYPGTKFSVLQSSEKLSKRLIAK